MLLHRKSRLSRSFSTGRAGSKSTSKSWWRRAGWALAISFLGQGDVVGPASDRELDDAEALAHEVDAAVGADFPDDLVQRMAGDQDIHLFRGPAHDQVPDEAAHRVDIAPEQPDEQGLVPEARLEPGRRAGLRCSSFLDRHVFLFAAMRFSYYRGSRGPIQSIFLTAIRSMEERPLGFSLPDDALRGIPAFGGGEDCSSSGNITLVDVCDLKPGICRRVTSIARTVLAAARDRASKGNGVKAKPEGSLLRSLDPGHERCGFCLATCPHRGVHVF